MNWRDILFRACVSGSTAGALSAVALAWLGKEEAGSAAAPLNAISHWLWGDEAFARDEVNTRNTASGVAIHHAMSIFWAFAFEAARPTVECAAPLTRRALATAILACVVDYTVTPRRLRPGFENRLRKPSLILVYLAFAGGLALGASLSGSLSRSISLERDDHTRRSRPTVAQGK